MDKNEKNKSYVVLIRSGINVRENMYKLYEENFGFVVYFIRRCKIPQSRFNDCTQLAYLALYDAVINFKFIHKMSFINYYKKWMIHYFYEDMLLMGYPMRITKTSVKEVDSTKWISIDEQAIVEIDNHEGHRLTDSISLFSIMQSDLVSTIWTLVDSELNEKNYYIIQQRFIHKRTLSSIGEELGIGKERVRLRILRSLNKLSKNKDLQQIAIDWFEIDVR